MIAKMSKYSFILLSGDKDLFLKQLQELGLVDIQRSSKPVDEDSFAIIGKINAIKSDISDIQKGSDSYLRELRSRKSLLEREAAASAPWGDFNPEDIERLRGLGLELTFYKVPEKKFDPEWENSFALQLVSRSAGDCYFTIVNAENFPVKAVAAPQRSEKSIREEIEEIDRLCEKHQAELAARSSEIPEMENQIQELYRELDIYLASARGESAAQDLICCFEGFAPADCDQEVEQALQNSSVYYWKEAASKEDNPPIKLKNNKFSKLFEGLTGMYGMPVYDEFDPTPVLSIFFMLFFAMCMGDAGYGLVLILFGIAVKKEWVKISMFRNMGPLISFLGVATFIVGIFLGTFFGISLHEQSWVPQELKNCMLVGKVMGYDIQMVLALGIGIFHICLAMIIKTVCYIKRFGVKQNISTIGWTLLIVGCVLVISLALLKWVPVDVAGILVIAIGAVSALGIFIFNKPGRNPLLNIGAGLWDTYNMATGILGDVLSYIRLYALGLAGGMLGGAFNNLGQMVLGSNPTWQWLPFVIILLFGHILNLLMSCLGAFVHPLRLTFVEYFKNSGYEGKGLKYNPLKK
ncbi:MAG: V-type ATP synthase subunit I [Candidatus Cryptobacteroides sp.]